MKLFKIIYISLFFLSNLVISEDNQSEYKIELIVFKYLNINSIESFNTKLIFPNEDIIYLYDKNSSIKEFKYSNFSNISKYISNIVDNGKGQNLNSAPSVWFRDDIEIIKLKDLEKKIINDDKLELIDAKSWIQTIPNLEDSKFLFYESKSKYYGFLLNFYKKRFMHIDLKAYLGNVNSRSSNINIFIDNDKKLFNDEVHFFDHPYFGLILSINEV